MKNGKRARNIDNFKDKHLSDIVKLGDQVIKYYLTDVVELWDKFSLLGDNCFRFIIFILPVPSIDNPA